MTSIEKARSHFPNALIVGGGGEGWAVTNKCWPGCRITFFATEDDARQAIATLPCSAQKCHGKDHHEVRQFKPDQLCWERD